jgi:hypothetical protein
LFPASSKAVTVYAYLALFFRPRSSKRDARPLKTTEAAPPFDPGARSISIALTSDEDDHVRIAAPSSGSAVMFEIVGGVASYFREKDVDPLTFPA